MCLKGLPPFPKSTSQASKTTTITFDELTKVSQLVSQYQASIPALIVLNHLSQHCIGYHVKHEGSLGGPKLTLSNLLYKLQLVATTLTCDTYVL